jgi:hypothetical protein
MTTWHLHDLLLDDTRVHAPAPPGDTARGH